MELYKIPVGVSNRHLHLAEKDLKALFGESFELSHYKDLTQGGQFATNEFVNVIGTKGRIDNVRVLGPIRKQTQVEISRTDSFKLGVKPPVRDSGELKDSTPIILEGLKGRVELSEGCIIAMRHIHMKPEDAEIRGLKDKDIVKVKVEGDRALIFDNVLVRVHPTFVLDFHIDTDEANAAGVSTGDIVELLR